jgi:hypothetical protein
MREDFIKAGAIQPPHYVPGDLRKLLLRLQPYLTPTGRPVSIVVKTLQIFGNCAPFLRGRQLYKEREHSPFSTADDADNVSIPCALALLTYELYPNILSVLATPQPARGKRESSQSFGLQHKIHVLHLLETLHPL